MFEALKKQKEREASAAFTAEDLDLTSKMTQQVQEISTTYCPQIKSGNGVFGRTDGGILVGIHQVPGVLIRSLATFTRLGHRLRKAAERGNNITLTIIE